MFVRFRGSPNRLQISIVETRRLNGRVRHEHIASLGSIEMPLSVAGRIAFWQRVNERLGKLSNRIDPAMQLVHEQVEAGDRAGRALVRRRLRERRGY